MLVLAQLPGAVLVFSIAWDRLSTVRDRRRQQRLHEDAVRIALRKCKSVEQVCGVMAEAAATHPEHLGARLPQTPNRQANQRWPGRNETPVLPKESGRSLKQREEDSGKDESRKSAHEQRDVR